MKRSTFAAAACLATTLFFSAGEAAAQNGYGAPKAFGQSWGQSAAAPDWNRFYHYPYVWYPQNFYSDSYSKSANDLYHRYPQEMRVPVYNRAWQNDYPKSRRYYQGHHFHLDVF
ncbi:MAG: calmodulin-binding protein [Planctomycetota bacterium]|nr:MAG: calmodulin-binding protein [Planctomycetota bacterium]